MELIYDLKQPKSLILEKTKLYNNFKLEPRKDNIVLQGENFKALSILLENGYRTKIDLIYIDPPFSTTNDFILSLSFSYSFSFISNWTL